MISHLKFSIMACLATALGLTPACWAGSADLKTDWSETLNPHVSTYGTWQFNQTNTPLVHINNWVSIPAQSGWGPGGVPSGSNQGPFIFKSIAGLTDPTSGIGAEYQPGDIVLHSQDKYNGPTNGQGTINWISPGEDTVSITGNLWPTRTLFQRENKYTLILNPAGSNTVLATGFILENGTITRNNPLSFNIPSLVVHAGDVLRLQIEQSGRVTGIQAGSGDFSGVNFTIASVPEPGSLAILALGTLLLNKRRR